MKHILILCIITHIGVFLQAQPKGPIQLHPENPHYFLHDDKAVALITSAEHYGAVINADFDYSKYLATLASDGMNYTRIFTGTYFEIPGMSFDIQSNTLAPAPDKRILPWGLSADGTKYDLSLWNPAYFTRLKSFLSIAQKNDIIVEITLFSSFYRDEHWEISPENPANNINLDGSLDRHKAHTLDNNGLLEYQLQFVRKIVSEVNEYDNIFLEIQNEPWSDLGVPVYNIMNQDLANTKDWMQKVDLATQASIDWQTKIIQEIRQTEQPLPKKHLIAQNYANFKAPLSEIHEDVSIINFHYAWPEAVSWNYHYDRVIGFDETGFAGSDDDIYRKQAWQFMLSGGGLYNNLDYSFYRGFENGKGTYKAPGGGSEILRRQLKILSDFLHDFELEKMKPNKTAVLRSDGTIPYILSDKDNNIHGIYLQLIGTDKVTLDLRTASGKYKITWVSPISGAINTQFLDAEEGTLSLRKIISTEEIALKIEKTN